jgi:hypothetical protein
VEISEFAADLLNLQRKLGYFNDVTVIGEQNIAIVHGNRTSNIPQVGTPVR